MSKDFRGEKDFLSANWISQGARVFDNFAHLAGLINIRLGMFVSFHELTHCIAQYRTSLTLT